MLKRGRITYQEGAPLLYPETDPLPNFAFENSLRTGTDYELDIVTSQFGGFKDHRYRFAFTRPWNDSYRQWQAVFNLGNVAGEDYKTAALNFLYRPVDPLQLVGSYEIVKHGDTQQQAILSANYDLGNDRSISGRAVLQDHDWNAYLAYRRSGNAGMEYFLILGDPNAAKFRSSLILKVTYPLQMFLGGH